MNVENYEIRKIPRSDINFAFYNPRKIKEKNKAKLKKSLKKFGIVIPPVWNVQTGNLVAGHQRLELIDQIVGNIDYEITVSAVSLSEKEEVEENIFLNNQSAMGEWDFDKLVDVKSYCPEIDFINDLGFEKFDLDRIEVDTGIKVYLDEPVKQENQLTEIEKSVRAQSLSKRRNEYVKQLNERDKEFGGGERMDFNDYTISFIFNSTAEKQKFMKSIQKKETEKVLGFEVLFDIARGKFF